MNTFIISEIGNQHGGDLIHAKELIFASKESGASAVKSQAFSGVDIQGSMPTPFYLKLEFTYDEYLELISYGNSIEIDVFFSVFSSHLKQIEEFQKYLKLAGSQVRKGVYDLDYYDHEDVFVSIPIDIIPPRFRYARMMYVSEYLTNNPKLDHIERLKRFYNKNVGYSDHTIGIENCVLACQNHGADVIEKHFTINKNLSWNGQTYRDNIHSATPQEFKEMVKRIRNLKLN